MKLNKSQLKLLSDYTSDLSKVIFSSFVIQIFISKDYIAPHKILFAGAAIVPTSLLLYTAITLRRKV